MHNHRGWKITFYLVLLACIAAFQSSETRLQAQFTTASLAGTVLDATGGAVPQAEATVLNTETGFTQTVVTGGTGAFLFPRLPVGRYELRVERDGFRTYVQSGIELTVDRAANVSVSLEVGSVTDQITVTGEAELITTRTATGSQLIDQKRIVELPLQGRRPERLMYLAAGTVDLGRNSCRICGQGGYYPGEETAGVNGTGQGQVNFQLDATSHNDTYLNTSLPFPNPDAVQEFSLQSSNFTAEYGNAGGGVVNVVVKGGTNEIHGTLFHFLRNGALNASSFFAPEQDTLKRNQFGGSVGGPIVRDKLFYFGTFQGTRLRETPAGLVQFVPTAAQRGGDFSSISEQLVDPVSHEPVPNNRIPESRLSPVAQYFLQSIPMPNAEDGRVTFPGAPKIGIDNQIMLKSDWVGGKHQVNGRYFFTDYDEPAKIVEDNLLALSNQAKAVRVQNISINHTFTASPTLLFNSTFGLNRQRGGSTSTAPFGMTAAGVNIIGPEGHPSIDSPPELIVSVSGAFSVNTNHLGDFDRGDFTVRHVATKIAGNHEFRMGGEAVRVSNHLINTYQMAGRVAFNGQLSGDPMADFIFGRTSNFRQGGGEFKDLKGTRWGFFIQDNWRASQRLTVNLGLRWDPYLPPYDRQGRVICFQPGVQSQRYPNAPTGVLYGGASRDASCPVAGSEPAWSNFGPRIGLAYRLTDDGRTSLRVGAGYFYTPERTGATNGLSNTAPFGATFDTYDVDWAEPYLSAGLANPFPANFGPEVPGPEFVFAPETRIRNYPSLDLRIPQIFTYSVRLERQFANSWVVGLGYIANKGTYLRDTQEANPAIYIPGASTVGNTQERRLIFPTFGSVTRVESGANSVYQSLQFNAEKRFARGYSILTNYTWSKTMSSEYGQDFLDSRREASIDGDDIPHNFKFSNVWDVPQTQMTGLAGKILNGWQLNSIVVWQSGFPFGVSSGRDNSFNGSTDRAQFIGAGSAQLSYDRPHGEMIEQWFDTSKFAVNPIGAYGNSGRNILRGPRFFNTDFGLLKVTQLTERVGMQFRAEFFNVFNNVNFRLPNSTVTSSSFGKITQVVADNQRIIQFGLKLIF